MGGYLVADNMKGIGKAPKNFPHKYLNMSSQSQGS